MSSSGDETAQEAIKRHPEVVACVLEWTWPYWAVYADRGYMMEAQGARLDDEYSFSGPRGAVLEYLGRYDCWDGIIDDEAIAGHVKGGVLRIRHDADCYDKSYLSEDPPKPTGWAELSIRMLRSLDVDPEASEEEQNFLNVWNS